MRAAIGVLFVIFSASPIRFPAVVSAVLVVLVFVLSYVDLQRRREGNLLHNLGIPVMLIVAISTIPALVAESAIEIAQSLSR